MIFTLWHNLIAMEKRSRAWHEDDIADEFAEYREAQGFMEKWSEVSDVVYTYTRAKWSGHSTLAFPLPRRYFFWGALYMFPKYTLRWLFFAVAGRIADSENPIREVRNPRKLSKVNEIAWKYHLDAEHFCAICQRLLRYWLVLE